MNSITFKIPILTATNIITFMLYTTAVKIGILNVIDSLPAFHLV